MNPAAEELRRILKRSSLGWTEQDGFEIRAAVTYGIAVQRRRRRMLAAGTIGAAALALGVLGFSNLRQDSVVAQAPSSELAPVPASNAATALAEADDLDSILPEEGIAHLADERVQVRFLAAGTRLRRVRARDGRAARAQVVVEAGQARFEVDKRKTEIGESTFRVAAGEVLVEVLGTVFTVDRSRPEQVAVSVEEGTVRVSWGAHTRLLQAGDAGVFTPSGAEPTEAPEVAPPAEIVAPATSAPARKQAASAPGAWRQLARVGRYDAAFSALKTDPRQMRDEPHDLMLAADVARLSRHPEDAVAPLTRVVSKYGRDDRAAPAAFLLGRVLLESLARPEDAARAFAQARGLAPAGPLAEDALAREVDALVRAGNRGLARQRAREYVARYPEGARLHEIRPYADAQP